MPTFAQMIAARDGAYHLDARIDGLAPHGVSTPTGGDTRYRWCVAVPTYADTGSTSVYWQSLLTDWPSLLGESIDVFGGMPKRNGRCTIGIVDHADIITTHHTPSARPLTRLAEDLDTTETGVDVNDGTTVTNGNLIFIGAECMRVTGIASNTLTVVRGWAGTDATTHSSNDRVFGGLPNILGRRMEIYISPTAQSDEQLVGEYVIDECRWSDAMNVWVIGGKSQLKYLDRALPRVSQSVKIIKYDEGSRSFIVEPTSSSSPLDWVHWTGAQADTLSPPTGAWGRVGDALLALNPSYRSVIEVVRRIDEGAEAGIKDLRGTLTRTMVCGFLPGTSFRVSLGDSGVTTTNLAASGWSVTDQWVDLIGCMASSPADGAFASGSNRNSTYGNWSSLPEGYGLGIPESLIDWGSFREVQERTREFRFPLFTLDMLGRSGPQVFDDFLKPMGATMVPVDGQLRLILSRAPLIDETVATTITTDDVLDEPEIVAQYNTALHTRSVTYRVGPNDSLITFDSSDFGEIFGQRNYYVDDQRAAIIDVPGGDPGLRSIYGSRAASYLWRLHRPHIVLRLAVHFETAWSCVPGTYVRVILPEMPDGLGDRDWDAPGVLATVLSRELSVDGGKATGTLDLLCYDTDQQCGRIAPSARIDSISVNTFTCTANRYSAEEADLISDLELTDVESFAAGDVVRLVDRSGVEVTGTTQIVQSIGANSLTLDGNFGGAASAGDLIVWAEYDDAATDQRTHAAWLADRSTDTVGTSADPFIWAEQ